MRLFQFLFEKKLFKLFKKRGGMKNIFDPSFERGREDGYTIDKFGIFGIMSLISNHMG